MNILLLGDASNFHSTLAGALRGMGHNVVVASEGSGWMDTPRDIDLYRNPGIIGTAKYAISLLRNLPRMRGYDVVQLHNPIFLHLRPEKLYPILDYLRRHNGKVVYEALGTDYFYVKACIENQKFRYSDYRISNKVSPHAILHPEDEQAWLSLSMADYNRYFINNIDGVIACLWEYYTTYSDIIPADKLGYGGIPIDIRHINASPITEEPEKVRFFIGIQRQRSALKGTDVMLEALKRVVERHSDCCEMCVVENLPYDEYVKRLGKSHILIDQLYSYTPATNALLAMARGMVVVSGAEPEYYNFIGERDNRPIVNVSPLIPDDVETKLEWLVQNKHMLPQMSQQSIDFVNKHNSNDVVAERHLAFWNKI